MYQNIQLVCFIIAFVLSNISIESIIILFKIILNNPKIIDIIIRIILIIGTIIFLIGSFKFSTSKVFIELNSLISFLIGGGWCSYSIAKFVVPHTIRNVEKELEEIRNKYMTERAKAAAKECVDKMFKPFYDNCLSDYNFIYNNIEKLNLEKTSETGLKKIILSIKNQKTYKCVEDFKNNL